MDEDLYSRQIAAYGLNIMNKLSELKILIVGLRGLGIEIAKNIILSGVNIYNFILFMSKVILNIKK